MMVGEVEVEGLELVVKAVVKLFLGCLNERMYFLWQLSLMPVEGIISNVSGHLFGMLMRVDFFLDCFSL